MVAIERRRQLVAEAVTLNGERAVIAGARNDFATVAQLGDGLRAEWAWETVERVVAAGGDFRY